MSPQNTFQQLQFSVFLFNSTSQTEICDSSKIALSEIGDMKMDVVVPKTACALGHLILLTILPGQSGLVVKKVRGIVNPEAIRLSGKVVETEPVADDRQLITLQFDQKAEEAWERFLQAFAGRQNEINQIVRAQRGS